MRFEFSGRQSLERHFQKTLYLLHLAGTGSDPLLPSELPPFLVSQTGDQVLQKVLREEAEFAVVLMLFTDFQWRIPHSAHPPLWSRGAGPAVGSLLIVQMLTVCSGS